MNITRSNAEFLTEGRGGNSAETCEMQMPPGEETKRGKRLKCFPTSSTCHVGSLKHHVSQGCLGLSC